jgi:glycine hydroxymethyltransferase
MLVDVGQKGLSGKECQLHWIWLGITVKKNTIPFETRSPFQASEFASGTQL